MRYYYAIIATDEFDNMICAGTLNTFAEKTEPSHIPITPDTFSEVTGKMWTGAEWVDNPNPPPEQEISVD